MARRFWIILAVAVLVLLLGLRGSSQVPAPAAKIESPPAGWPAEPVQTRGDELRARRESASAVEYYRAALAKVPEDAFVWNKMGIAHLQMLEYRNAVNQSERALKRKPGYADVHNNLGVVYYIQRDYKKAIKQPINDAYRDAEFAALRKNARFKDLMGTNTPIAE